WIEPERAEELNRRLAYAMGADRSGWDLTQLLRIPGCRNYKYEGAPESRIIHFDDALVYNADELERTLPPAPAKASASRTTGAGTTATGTNEPPVRLDADSLRWWTGERFVRKEHSADPDRSATLYVIGERLARANASPSAIAAALAERDAAFGWHRYA